MSSRVLHRTLGVVALATTCAASGYALARRQQPEVKAASHAELAVTSTSDAEAVSKAHRTVTDAIARGRWTASDRAALRPLMPRLTQAEREELIGELFPAINRGALKLDVRGGPL